MSTNSVTGDRLITRPASKEYMDNYDAIFKKKDSEKSKCKCSNCERKKKEVTQGNNNK